MNIVKFRAEHLQRLKIQRAQESFRADFGNPDYGKRLEACTFAFTALDDEGEVLGCSGVEEIWPGRAVAWALLSADAGPHFRSIHRAVHGFLKQANWRRVEMMVEDGFDQGHRWARMLGMEHEGCMKAYSPSGVDFHIYARVKQNG